MEILLLICSIATLVFFMKWIFNFLKYQLKKRKTDVSDIKKRSKKNKKLFIVCYILTIFLGVMVEDTQESYNTSDEKETAKIDTDEQENTLSETMETDDSENSSENNLNDTKEEYDDEEGDDESEEYIDEEAYYDELEEYIDDEVYYDESEEYNDEEAYYGESEEYSDDYVYEEDFAYDEEKIKEIAQSYDTLLTYKYENSSKGKKIIKVIENGEKADKKEYVYLEEKNDFFTNKKSYEVTLEQTNYIYYGKIKKNKPDGYGILYYEGIPIFIGEFNKGKKDGYGIEIEDDMGGYYIYYEGEYKDGEMEGEGKEYIGIINEEDDEAYGYQYAFIRYEEDGLGYLPLIENTIFYDGDFESGNFSNKGTMYYADGQVLYEGKFANGKYNGKGTLYYKNGQVMYKGKFKNGKYHGKGTLYYEDGTVKYKGKFKNGDVE